MYLQSVVLLCILVEVQSVFFCKFKQLKKEPNLPCLSYQCVKCQSHEELHIITIKFLIDQNKIIFMWKKVEISTSEANKECLCAKALVIAMFLHQSFFTKNL